MISGGPTAIITGGATSIGAEIVRTFVAAGYRVAIADIGPRACFLATDLLTLAMVGYVPNRLFLMIENRVLAWHYGNTQQRS